MVFCLSHVQVDSMLMMSPNASSHLQSPMDASQPAPEALSKYQFIFDWGYPPDSEEDAVGVLLQALAAHAPSPSAHAHAWTNEYEHDDGAAEGITAVSEVRVLAACVRTHAPAFGGARV